MINNLDVMSVGMLIVLALVFGEVVKLAVAYFWRKLTNTEKYITKADLKLHMQDIMKEFMKGWCRSCDVKQSTVQDRREISCLIEKIDVVKKILAEVAITSGIDPAKIAQLTGSGRNHDS